MNDMRRYINLIESAEQLDEINFKKAAATVGLIGALATGSVSANEPIELNQLIGQSVSSAMQAGGMNPIKDERLRGFKNLLDYDSVYNRQEFPMIPDTWRIKYLATKHKHPSLSLLANHITKSLELSEREFAHWYYIMVSASATIFSFEPECKLLFGFSSYDEGVVEQHAKMMVTMLLGNPEDK